MSVWKKKPISEFGKKNRLVSLKKKTISQFGKRNRLVSLEQKTDYRQFEKRNRLFSLEKTNDTSVKKTPINRLISRF